MNLLKVRVGKLYMIVSFVDCAAYQHVSSVESGKYSDCPHIRLLPSASLDDCLSEACMLEANVVNFYRKQSEVCDNPQSCLVNSKCTIKKCSSVADEESMSFSNDYRGADVWASNDREHFFFCGIVQRVLFNVTITQLIKSCIFKQLFSINIFRLHII